MELSKEEKAARAEYYRKWRVKNPEKVLAFPAFFIYNIF